MNNHSGSSHTMTERCKVLILGGGMAGFSAARTLADHGINDFLILEAQPVIGGRMRTQNFAGVTIEEGANWVHGIDGNPVWEMAARLSLSGAMTPFQPNIDLAVIDETGCDRTGECMSRYQRLELVNRQLMARVESYTANDLQDESLRQALTTIGWRAEGPLELAIDYFGYDFERGEVPEKTSMKYGSIDRYFTDFSYNQYFICDERGFTAILKNMLTSLLDTHVRVNTIVQSVNANNKGTPITVTTTDGRVFQSEYVICTFSIGVLRKNNVKFTPDFGPQKRDAINSFGLAAYTKIFVKFPMKFWHGHVNMLLLAGKERGYYTSWQDLSQPGLFPPGHFILMATVTGDEARRVELLADHVIQQEMMTVLRGVYGHKIPEPSHIHVCRWTTDQYFHQAYSHWPTHFSIEDFQHMGEPIGNVHFAGEAYSEWYFGTLQGAFYSGTQTATKISALLQKCKL